MSVDRASRICTHNFDAHENAPANDRRAQPLHERERLLAVGAHLRMRDGSYGWSENPANQIA